MAYVDSFPAAYSMIASQTYVLEHISKNYILRSIALCHPQHHANPHEPHNETLSESSTLRVLCTLLTGAAVSWRCPRGLEEDHLLLLLVVGGEAGLVLGVDTGHQHQVCTATTVTGDTTKTDTDSAPAPAGVQPQARAAEEAAVWLHIALHPA